MSTLQDDDIDSLAFPEPSPSSSLYSLPSIASSQIPTSLRSHRVASTRDESPKPVKPNLISRLLKVTKRYTTSTASKARNFFNTALGITPPTTPIDRYLPAEIAIHIFSYLPWETQLACSLASRIWGEILWNHGQDYTLLKASNDRYTAPRRYIGILYHKIFFHRPCEIEISKDGIQAIALSSNSPWEPIPFAQNKLKLYRQKSNISSNSLQYISSSSSSSDDSFSEVSAMTTISKEREVVHINPQNNFVMNDTLLKLNPNYTPKRKLFRRIYPMFSNNGLSFHHDDKPSHNCTIILLLATNEIKTGTLKSRKTIRRRIATDAERESITFKTFLEYVAQVATERQKLEEGEVRKVNVDFMLIKDKDITFVVYPIED